MVERKNFLSTGKNFHQNQKWCPSASTTWGLRGQERVDTRPGIPTEKEKHKLMTTIYMYVHRYMESKESGVSRGASQEVLQ